MPTASKLVSFGPTGTGTNSAYQVAVSANGTQLRPAVAGRVGLTIYNVGPGILYVGKNSADLPAGATIPVSPGQAVSDPDPGIAPDTGVFYGSPESGKTCDVRIWETT